VDTVAAYCSDVSSLSAPELRSRDRVGPSAGEPADGEPPTRLSLSSRSSRPTSSNPASIAAAGLAKAPLGASGDSWVRSRGPGPEHFSLRLGRTLSPSGQSLETQTRTRFRDPSCYPPRPFVSLTHCTSCLLPCKICGEHVHASVNASDASLALRAGPVQQLSPAPESGSWLLSPAPGS